MEAINWYQVRHYLKWTLTFVTVLFFLVTVVQLLAVKQFYIKRYVEMHLIEDVDSSSSFDGRHKVFQVDEEIDLAKFNLTESSHSSHPNETMINLPAEHRHEPKNEASHHNHDEENRFSVEVKFITGIIVAAIIVIEMLYCVLYLYIIAQKRFCSMFCFAILSFLSLIFHVQLHLTIPVESVTTENNSTSDHHQADTFFTHIDSLDPESLVNHITRSSLVEVVLSVVETILALAYSALLYKFPGRHRSHHHRLAGFLRLGGAQRVAPMANNGRLPNGHAVAIEMNSIDEQNDADENADADSFSQSSSSISSSSDHAIEGQQMADNEARTVERPISDDAQMRPVDDRPLIDGTGGSDVVVR